MNLQVCQRDEILILSLQMQVCRYHIWLFASSRFRYLREAYGNYEIDWLVHYTHKVNRCTFWADDASFFFFFCLKLCITMEDAVLVLLWFKLFYESLIFKKFRCHFLCSLNIGEYNGKLDMINSSKV